MDVADDLRRERVCVPVCLRALHALHALRASSWGPAQPMMMPLDTNKCRLATGRKIVQRMYRCCSRAPTRYLGAPSSTRVEP